MDVVIDEKTMLIGNDANVEQTPGLPWCGSGAERKTCAGMQQVGHERCMRLSMSALL